MYVRYRFLLLFPLAWQFLFLCLSPSLSLSHRKREVGRYVSEESNYNAWIIQSEKSLATPDYFDPYLVIVATKEYCSICLETAIISEEFGMKILMVVAAVEE